MCADTELCSNKIGWINGDILETYILKIHIVHSAICSNLLHILPIQTANEGESCVLDGAVYRNGEAFFPSCSYQCMCREGYISCVPRCNLEVMLPGPDCPHPRKVQIPGECCEKWVCEPQVETSVLGGFAMAGELLTLQHTCLVTF